MKTLKVVCLSILLASVVPLLFWLGGFNFDERGEGALFCGILTLYVLGSSLALLPCHIEDKP